MIEYRGIYKSFDIPVLKGVSLAVEPGEMFGIFGPSGTGKSVLLKTTIALITPDRGDVRVDGDSVFFGNKDTLQRVRRKVGFVFQNAALFDSVSVYENVRMGIPEAVLARTSEQEVRRRCWESVEQVKLEPREVLGKAPSELSGGMRKRVGIARAIVGRPQILLWDEPTTGLDPINSAAVERLILNLSKDLEVTSVIVTHDIEGGLAISDRVALLEGGHLRYCGSPEDFVRSQDPVVQAFVDRAAAEAAVDTLDVS